MLVSFAVARRSSGERVIAEFNLRLRYAMEPFNFDPRVFTTDANISEINNRFADIEQANIVDLIGTEPVRVDRTAVTIDGGLYIYPTGHDLFWTFLRPGTREHVPKRDIPRLSEQLKSVAPEVIGAVRLRLPVLRHDMHEYVRRHAKRRAQAMKSNAENILWYLGES